MPQPWPEQTHATPADLAACRALLCNGSRSFHTASRVMPRRERDAAVGLYAFCRAADDAVDGAGGDVAAALERLRARLDGIYAGTPAALPCDRAFADVVARHEIPRTLPESLLEGFAWDAAGLCYRDLAALLAYATRVAGSVGAMMALLMGAREPWAIARACDLGMAMQLTNIARDVGEDARSGRLYLPLDWLVEEGVDAHELLAAPQFTPALGRVVSRLLSAADALYQRGSSGIAALPASCRPAMHAAGVLYAEIGREIERRGYDSVSSRAVVPAARKLKALTRRVGERTAADALARTPALAASAHLVEAVTGAPPRPSAPDLGRIEARVDWLVGLFHRLDARERHAQRQGV